MRDDRGLDQGASNGGSEEYLDSAHILEVEMAEFAVEFLIGSPYDGPQWSPSPFECGLDLVTHF